MKTSTIPKNPIYIETSELNDLMNDPVQSKTLKIINANAIPPEQKKPGQTNQDFFLKERIPHSIFFDLNAICDKNTTLPCMLAPEQQFQKQMEELDIKVSDTLVIYDDIMNMGAARAWFTYEVFGHKKKYILNGNFYKWKSEKFPVETTAPRKIIPGTKKEDYNYKLNSSLVVNLEMILENIKNYQNGKEYIQLLDARSKERFYGKMPEPRPGLSSGHMPGSINLFHCDLQEENNFYKFKSHDSLKKLFDDRKINFDKKIIMSCGSGVSAAVLYIGAKILNAKNVVLYDGSWTEYASQQNAIIKKEED